MTRIGIIVGSTRPGRRAAGVADWVAKKGAELLPDTEFGIVDLADFALPLLDEPHPPMFGRYTKEHTRAWAAAVDGYDGYVFVVPEYNHSIPAVLKNALDYLYNEWGDKAAGFVGYGVSGGTRAVEQLRLILAELRVATVRSQVALSLWQDFTIPDVTQPGEFTPAAHQEQSVTALLNEVVAWSQALAPLRVTA
ncbi:NADPH-dependent FMN reductase [Kitasatospora sp. NPDC086801]|uniref:NADPH-dependent FMN reductase n=1 Tax=Kitasatospora sp. NPDC086801 TaxID=3364066 RepID=UPI00380A9F8B